MSHVRRLPIVAVIGSGDPDHGNPELSEAIGRLIAEMGYHLLTGGGRGVMADASRGFTSVPRRPGLALGIIPRSVTGDEEKEGYPNPWVELPIQPTSPTASAPTAKTAATPSTSSLPGESSPSPAAKGRGRKSGWRCGMGGRCWR